MEALVVYFSKFGNTKMVAEAIGEVFDANGSARVIDCDQLDAGELKEADLVVMGSPTHRMNLPEAVGPVFDRLPKRVLPGTPVAAFDTSYKMSPFLMPFTASKRLAKKLRKLGGKRLAPPESFFVMEREGPLYEGELERARTWAEGLLEGINGG